MSSWVPLPPPYLPDLGSLFGVLLSGVPYHEPKKGPDLENCPLSKALHPKPRTLNHESPEPYRQARQ